MRSEDGNRPGHASTGRWLLAVVVVSFGLKLALLWPAHAVRPVNDAAEYGRNACTLLRTGGYGRSGRPPGYPMALAATLGVVEAVGVPVYCHRDRLQGKRDGIPATDVARVVQVLWSTVTVLLAFLLGRALYDHRTGLATATMVAFYPALVGFSHLLFSETLYVMLSFGWACLLVRGARTGSVVSLLGAGLLLGYGALVRQAGIPTIVLAIAFLASIQARPWRRTIGRSLLVAVTAAAVVLPWTVRNHRVYDDVVLVSTTSGWALLYGASPNLMSELNRLEWSPGPAFGYHGNLAAGARAREIIRADPSAWLRRLRTVNLPSLWHPGFDGVIAHLVRPYGYQGVSPGVARTVIVLIVGSFLLLGVLATAGLAFTRIPAPVVLVLGLAVLYTLLHTVVWGLPRHRLPVMAFATMPAGYLLTRSRQEWAALFGWRRAAAAVFGPLVFLWLVTSNDDDRLQRRWKWAADLPHVTQKSADESSSPGARTWQRPRTRAKQPV